ncbi:Ig-like domain-containing protein, partial [Verrucomicrobiota bacterium]
NTVADTNGNWRVDLDPMSASTVQRDFVVTGTTNVITLTEILVGEVWFGGGQSNINHPGSVYSWVNSFTILPPQGLLTNVRICFLQQDTDPSAEDVLNPNPNLINVGGWSYASWTSTKVPHYFARGLYNMLGSDVPVGVVWGRRGGGNIAPWVPAEVMRTSTNAAVYQRYVERTNNLAHIRQAIETYGYATTGNREALERSYPGHMFSAMVAAVFPYAIKGALWYQGENNMVAGDVDIYTDLQEHMVDGWKAAWGYDFPFIYGAVALYFPVGDGYPDTILEYFDDTGQHPPVEFTDAQRRHMERDTNVFMVATVDIGDTVHPKAKPDAGSRFTLAALGACYGMTNNYLGPSITNLVYNEGRMYLYFDHADGLKTTKIMTFPDGIGSDAYTLGEDGVILKRTMQNTTTDLVIQDDSDVRLRGFVFKDDSGDFHEVSYAKISNNVVELRFPGGKWVDAVACGSGMRKDGKRYIPNLYNTNNLPLIGFYETDFVYMPPSEQPPLSDDDSYIVSENFSIVVSDPGILANDWDANADPFSAELVQDVANGDLVFSANGGFTYTPSNNFVGVDTFTYRCLDGAYGNTATVSIIVLENIPPVSSNNSYLITQDEELTVDAPGVLVNDSDANGSSLTSFVVADTTNATLVLNTDGSFTYTPSNGYSGIDGFTYHAHDGTDYGNVATVQVTVVAHTEPVANSDFYWTTNWTGAGEPINIPAPGILGNDTDINEDSLTAEKLSDPANGLLAFNTNGSFIYTPNHGFAGLDSFTYRAYDGALYSPAATVNLKVVYPPEFKIHRGSGVIPTGSTALTLVNTDHYTLSTNATISSAFIRLVNSGLSGGGSTNGADEESSKKHEAWIDNPGNLLTSVDIKRGDSSSSCAVSWEIIEYVGTA